MTTDSFKNAPHCDHLTSRTRERSVEMERERSSQSDDGESKTTHVSSYSISQPEADKMDLINTTTLMVLF